ncbi:MAG TPA: glutamate--cysteine ligase [Rubrobacteraceae bacterium]|nr:glutamate--cysteine ligase [Rubrobacteraceae bacterium]
MEARFGATPPYTVGVEEEFQLVDSGSRELSPAVDGVLAAGKDSKLITSELSQSCVEMLSPVFGTVADLSRELPGLRREVRRFASEGGVEIASAGTHPFSDPTGQPLNQSEHHRTVEKEMGWVARTQAIYGLHVHVAVPDGETAIRAVGALSRYVPLLIALASNSPFWRGEDTRLASTRIKIFEIFPRSGLPPAFRNWKHFERHIETLVASGSIPDYSWCWWDVRPHQRFGTVEVRALDAQTDPACTTSLTALIQCVVATSRDHAPEDPLLTAENKWRAARFGMDATFYDFDARREINARALARSLVERLRPVSQDLGCEEELAGVLKIVDHGTGAELQRAAFGRTGSLQGVVEYLVSGTAAE